MISFQLNESLANRYGKSGAKGHVKKAFEFSLITEALKDAPENAVAAECSVVFSDISGFSTLVAECEPSLIKEFLDAYYATIIPIVYEHGGLIDQMMGDGIISVFTPILSNAVGNDVFNAGLKAAEAIVSTFAGDEYFSTKCAFHKGEAVICQIGDENYRQATIVGNIMTVVHRVESVAEDEAVNMLLSIPEAKAMFDRICRETRFRRQRGERIDASWDLSESEAHLKGVGPGKQPLLIQKYIGQ